MVKFGGFRRWLHGDARSLASTWTIPFVALLLAGTVLAWVSVDEYHEVIDQEYRFLDAHTRIAQNEVADLVHDVRQVLGHVAEEYPRYPGQRRSAFMTRLTELRREVPDVRMLAVLDPAGRIEVGSNADIAGFDASGREYFTAHQQGARRLEFHISRPYKTIYGDHSVSFSLPILDDQGQLLGIAVAAIHYNAFKSILSEIRPARPRSTAAVVNNEGDFIYHLPYADSSAGRNASANQAFLAFLKAGRRPTRALAASLTDGLARLYVIRPIEGTPLNVGATLPLDDALAPWRRNLVLRGVLFVLGMALILRLAWTAHRRQQEALAGRQFSDRLMDTANAMMIAVDHDGVVIAANEAAERTTGFPRKELVGRSWFETAMPRDRLPGAWTGFLRYRANGEVPRSFEAPIVTRAGEKRVIAWQTSPFVARDGTPGTLSFGIDITERSQLLELRNREQISRRLVSIQEEERRRLAVELHDRSSPNLTVLDINLKLLADSLPADAPPQVFNLIEDTQATLSDTIAAIRAVSFDFRPPLLDYAGLWPTLDAYVRQFGRRTGIATEIAIEHPELKLAPEIETNLFRIAQEALTNCARHSLAGRMSIRQSICGEEAALVIEDDGVGFDAGGEWGEGLTMMRQRAEFIGGTLDVDSHPGEGTRITIAFSACGAETCPAQGSSSQASAPSAAARPPAKHAVSR
ncbi:MAG TPA: PAS domain S-box protein [Rhodocyclaceae bacterium]